jgi:hypothetical protein
VGAGPKPLALCSLKRLDQVERRHSSLARATVLLAFAHRPFELRASSRLRPGDRLSPCWGLADTVQATVGHVASQRNSGLPSISAI